MPGPLISPDYLTTFDGRTFTAGAETDRVNGLIAIASNLVRGACKRDFSSTTAPELARVAVARLVLSALDQGSGSEKDTNLRVEQIGDYRVEYQRTPAVQDMDLTLVEDLIKRITKRAYSVRLLPALDGPMTTWPDGGVL